MYVKYVTLISDNTVAFSIFVVNAIFFNVQTTVASTENYIGPEESSSIQEPK